MSVREGREGARQAASGALARTTSIVSRGAERVRKAGESYTSVERAAYRRLGEISREAGTEIERAVTLAAERVARATGGTEADAKAAILETLGRGGVRELVAQHIAPAERSVRRMVDVARREGIPPAEVARDLARLLGTGADAYSATVRRKYGLSNGVVSDLYTVRTDLRRVAATAPMNVMRATATRSMLRAGHDLARWTLSPVHAGQDACDDLAGASTSYGRGVYLLLAWPNAPHPHCGCYPVPVDDPSL